eukprot:scaffold135383_cov19-Tisochrysis_lutea.AAC.1
MLTLYSDWAALVISGFTLVQLEIYSRPGKVMMGWCPLKPSANNSKEELKPKDRKACSSHHMSPSFTFN